MKYYTGIGSRETPSEILALMTKVGQKLASEGWCLRSGGAEGADTAFEEGWWANRMTKDVCYTSNDYECYIPWSGFNGHTLVSHDAKCINPSGKFASQAEQVAARMHPAWDAVRQDGTPVLSPAAKKLHTRNVFQIMGKDLNTPSRFVVAYAKTDKHGTPKGGTATAIALAKKMEIPVFNLYLPEDLERLQKFVGG